MTETACPQRGCCYSAGGGTGKCTKCNDAYLNFVKKNKIGLEFAEK